MILNANSIVQLILQTKNGIMINVNASVALAKMFTVGILAHVFVRIIGIQKVFW